MLINQDINDAADHHGVALLGGWSTTNRHAGAQRGRRGEPQFFRHRFGRHFPCDSLLAIESVIRCSSKHHAEYVRGRKPDHGIEIDLICRSRIQCAGSDEIVDKSADGCRSICVAGGLCECVNVNRLQKCVHR